ncbi:MAG: dTMP kinase [Proteobacteria bacterium]|nr:dTMP kinase [Pseudomonadota bacterium]
MTPAADNDIAKRPGHFVVFEGIDGSGKSTQARRLAEVLGAEGREVVLTREPTDGLWGQKIRQIAAKGRQGIDPRTELDYFVNDRQEHVDEVIAPALAAGQVVICDRYFYSTIAYQGALGLDPDLIRQENEGKFPRPDLVILLEVPPNTGRRRIEAGRAGGTNQGYEGPEFLERVGAIFARMDDDNIRRIDATRPADEVFEAVLDACGRLLESTTKDNK